MVAVEKFYTREEEMELTKFLNTLSVYLSGPISYTEPSWRLDFAEKLEKVGKENSVKVDVYIPLEAKEESAQTIINRDLDMIQRVDLIVSYIFCPTSGTPVEMFYCHTILKKPVYCLCTIKNPSPWIIGFATKLYKTEQGFFAFFDRMLKEQYGAD